LTEARQQLERDLGSADGGIAFSKTLFVLTERTQGNEVLPFEAYAMDGAIHTGRKWAVIQEWDERRNNPPIYPGYELVLNRYSSLQQPRGRLAQWFQPAGFQYAVYRKKETGRR
jgi:hypothetical protein